MDSLYRFTNSYFNSRKNEYDEYVIKAWRNGKRYEEADYYTDDYDDAVDTMNLLRKEYYND